MDVLEYYKKLLQVDNMPAFLKHMADTPCIIRLKNVDYFCGMKYASPNLDIYKFEGNPTRYDHSITTALITWKLTRQLRQTTAALYHDVATPCFSHTIDYMNKDYVKQESTEEFTKEIIDNDPVIPRLLDYYNIKKDDVVNYKKYPIVDNKRPKLCADRLDGIITTGISWTKSLNENEIKDIVYNMALFINEDEELEIGFKNEDVAQLVFDTAAKINEYTHKEQDIYMMELLAKITKLLIEKGYIEYKNLYIINENTLLEIIKNSNDEEILDLFNLFQSIKEEDIKLNKRVEIKSMNLNPLVKGRRLK